MRLSNVFLTVISAVAFSASSYALMPGEFGYVGCGPQSYLDPAMFPTEADARADCEPIDEDACDNHSLLQAEFDECGDNGGIPYTLMSAYQCEVKQETIGSTTYWVTQPQIWMKCMDYTPYP